VFGVDTPRNLYIIRVFVFRAVESGMRIDVRELDSGPVRIQGEVSPAELGLGSADGKVLEPVGVTVVAEKHGLQIRVRGHITAALELTCARCLDPVKMGLSPEFDQFYQPNAGSNLTGEIALTKKDTDIAFFNGNFIDVVDILREQILLALPMKPVCREDCRGFCPYCGGNRNLKDCGCESTDLDPRLAPLRTIKNQMS
jgi:DUF177 domain-containing protein